MRRFLILFFSLFVLGLNFSNPVYAKKTINIQNVQQTQINKQLNDFLDKFLKFSNEHNIEGLKSLYAQNYVSGDGIKKDDMISLMKETWESYPNLKYESEIKDIRISDNLAAVESFDKSSGITANKSDITNDSGILQSESHNIVYLQRFGKDWKIISDRVNYEKTMIKYGVAKGLKVDLYAPEQVYAKEDYTATIVAEIPDGIFAIGSIAREPIVYPQTKSDEVFRQIPNDVGVLERVMKANSTNNNELAVASVGFTEMVEDFNAKPDIKLTGLAIILTRVNVIPISTYVKPEDKPKVDEDIDSDSNVMPEEFDDLENDIDDAK